MAIFRTKGKRSIRWGVDLEFPDGTRFRKVVGGREQAEQLHKKLEADIFEGRWWIRPKKYVNFDELVVQYLEYAKANKADSTFAIDKCRIHTHLLPFFKGRLLNQITPQTVEQYKTLRVHLGAKPKTINNELLNLSHMLTMAVRWGYIGENVVRYTQKLKIGKRTPRYLTKDEIHRLLDAAEGSHLYPLLLCALHTGMRKSELFHIQWSDINFEQSSITVQSKGDWHTKNYKPRTFAMTPELKMAFRQLWAEQQALWVNIPDVFTWQGKPIRHTITRALRKILKKAGLEGVTLHALRHTFASHLVMAGVPLRDVQELMGHQSFETTLRYAHLSPEHVKKQVLKLPYTRSDTIQPEAYGRNTAESSLLIEKPKNKEIPRTLTALGI